MKYANKECADCNVILPANEMVKATDRIYSGTTKRFTRVRGNYQQTGATQNYRTKSIFLCPGCSTKRRIWRNRKIGLATGAAAALLVVNGLSEKPTALEPSSTSEAVVTKRNAKSEMPTSIASNPSERNETADTAKIAVTTQETKPSLRKIENTRDASDDDMIGYIENYIQLALSDNRNTEWSMENREGFVEVTSAPSSDGRVCRNFKVFILDGTVSRQIGGGTKCKTLGTAGWIDV